YFIKLLEQPSTFASWTEFIRHLEEVSSSKNGVLAVKVMASDVKRIERVYASMVSRSDATIQDVIESIGIPYYMRVSRQDVARQAISRLMARHTGVYHHVRPNVERYGAVAKR